MTAVCPFCYREQGAGLLCSACCAVLERELSEVPAIVADLDVTLSRQGRIGSGGKGGLASEKTPIHTGAMDPVWVLGNVLTTWARDIAGDPPAWPTEPGNVPAVVAAHLLLSEMTTIRKHPAADEIMDEVCDAIRLARRTIDRPGDRQFIGPCNGMFEGVTCASDLTARPGDGVARCKVCGHEVDVIERRSELLDDARDRIVTVREAAQWVTGVGRIEVTEDRIRGYIRWDKLLLRSIPDGVKAFRLGDLLDLLTREHERKERRLARAS